MGRCQYPFLLLFCLDLHDDVDIKFTSVHMQALGAHIFLSMVFNLPVIQLPNLNFESSFFALATVSYTFLKFLDTYYIPLSNVVITPPSSIHTAIIGIDTHLIWLLYTVLYRSRCDMHTVVHIL